MNCFTCNRPLGTCNCVKPFKHYQTKAEKEEIRQRNLRGYKILAEGTHETSNPDKEKDNEPT